MPAYTNGILSQLPGLNWLLLVEVITVVIASLFWFFYLNRFIVRRTYIVQLTSQGLLLSWAIRLYTWRYLNARIEIRAINIAPLAGRIAFKDVRYYSRNQSLRVLKGHVTWRYWLWRVRDDEIGAKVRNNQSRPCRFAIELEGVEWFLYNRTDSYDKALEAIGMRYDEETGKVEKAEESIRMDAVGKRPASTDNSGIDWVREILPVEIHAHTGAIILGNRSTPMLLITGFDEVKGAFSVVEARSKFDLYKQVYEFTFSRVRSVFRTNPDFTCSMRDHGRQVVQSLREEHGSLAAADFARTRSPADYLPFPRFFRLLQSLGLVLYVAGYEAKVRGKWEGLARYRPSIDYSITLDAGSSTEYAKVPTLLQAPRIKLEYYCDTAGAVPPLDQQVQNLGGLEGIDIGNGDLTPEWGVDVSIEAGRINYGPWTERQRSELFALFLPATYNDEPATVRKQPGDLREHVALKIFIQFDDKTVIHLPTREQSKDWQYDGKSAPSDHRHQDDRPYGWFDLEAGADSCLSFTIPFVTATEAYESVFELHLDEFNITSSVISGRLLAAESCRVHCSMPAPLKWDAPREWQFNIGLSKPQLFFLSDHGHLIADLVSDFTSAPPGELLFFQPTTYTFDITFSDYSIVLHLNERNIIRDANSTDSNTLVWLKGPRLTARVTAPSDQFEPVTTTVGFNVAAERVAFSITVPQWDTHDSFVSEADRQFCTVDEFKIDGSYLFYAHVQPDNIERLILNVDARNTVLKPMIWVVKPLVLFVANYIGTMTHFHTLEEVNALKDQGPAALAAGLLDPLDSKHRAGTKDFYEVKLSLAFHDTLVVVPGEHYECRSGLLVYIPDVAFDFRNHDLFADMTLQVDPIELCVRRAALF